MEISSSTWLLVDEMKIHFSFWFHTEEAMFLNFFFSMSRFRCWNIWNSAKMGKNLIFRWLPDACPRFCVCTCIFMYLIVEILIYFYLLTVYLFELYIISLKTTIVRKRFETAGWNLAGKIDGRTFSYAQKFNKWRSYVQINLKLSYRDIYAQNCDKCENHVKIT